jgi:hypothetical protein
MKTLFVWIDVINNNFWKRVFNSTQSNFKSLCAFRVIFGLFLLFINTPNFSWISKIPHALFSPPPLSISNLFNSFPNATFFYSTDILIFLSSICITLGIKTRAFSIIYLTFCLIGLNFQYSFGKIDHENLIYALLFCMAFSDWGCGLALWPDKMMKSEWAGKSLAVLSVFICFAMFTAGFGKALVWVDLDTSTSGFLGWSQRGIIEQGRNYLLSDLVASFPPFLLEAIDYIAVIFELSPIIFLLYSKSAWKIWLLVACFFHLGNTLFLNIPFMSHSLLYLVFVDFSWLYDKIYKLFSVKHLKLKIVPCFILLLILRIVLFFNQQSPLYGKSYSAKLNLGLTIWIISSVIILASIIKDNIRLTNLRQKSDYPS